MIPSLLESVAEAEELAIRLGTDVYKYCRSVRKWMDVFSDW